MDAPEVPTRRDRLENAALRGVLGALRAPGRDASLALGRGLGRVVARVAPLRRDVALDNLARAFPDMSAEERRDVYRRMCVHLGETLADFARFPRMSRGDVLARVDMDGIDAFLERHRSGSGALLLTGHFGNWEILAAGLAAHGLPVTLLGARQRNPLVEDLFSEYRGDVGAKVLTLRHGKRALVAAFRSGGWLASLADQDGGRHGFFLDFLGRPASVQGGLFRLAARTGVPVFTGFAVRHGKGWRMIAEPAIETRPARGAEAVEAEARRLAEAFTRRLEAQVRARPDHWFWVHRRWKTRPPGEGGATPVPGR